MGAVGVAIWQFLNSPFGMTLVLSGLGYAGTAFWKWLKGKDSKVARSVELMADAWTVAEKQGLLKDLPGVEKWKIFVQTWIDARRAEGLGMPTGAEMKVAEQYAMRRAWLEKPVKEKLAAQLATVK